MAQIINLEERRRQKQQGCEAWAEPQNFGGFKLDDKITVTGLIGIERQVAFVKPCPYKLHDD